MRKKFFKKQNKKFIRSNEQIRASEVRVVDENKENLGVLSISKAISIARERGLDLVEISANANPPVCKITDFGKYQYTQEKKDRKQKAKQKRSELKGIRIGFSTSSHDLETKVKQTEKFLKQTHKVRIEIRLRGRERAHTDLAKERLETFLEMISLEFKKEEETKKSPRGFSVTICQIKQINQ